MRAVQLQPIETGLRSQTCRVDKVITHAVHVFTRHGVRPLAHAIQILLGRCGDERPVLAVFQRQVDALPRRARRALGARMAQLNTELGIAVGMHELDDARPAVTLFGVPQTRASGGDARIGRHAGHLGHHQPRAAHGARAQVHKVVVGGLAAFTRVLRHGRYHHAVLERDAAHGEGREHRRHRAVLGRARRTGLLGNPVFKRFEIGLVALAQVFVADALAAREQRVCKLRGRQAGVARHVLKPLGRVARRVLDAQHFHAAHGFIVFERAFQVAGVLANAARQLNRIFQRQLGARADREMRRVCRIAHQHNRCVVRIGMHPMPANHARKANPLRRAAQVRGVGDQLVAIKVLGEQTLAIGDGVFLLHRLQPRRAPHLFWRLDDEGGGLVIKAVRVRLKPAVLGLFKRKGERLEQLVRAQPDKAAAARVDIGLIRGGVLGADAAVQAVAGDDEVGIGVSRVILHVGFKDEFDALFLTARLQDVQQALAPDAAEAVAARAHDLPSDVDFNVVPVVEGVEDLRGALGVGALQVAQRLVGEHHAPAERVIRAVALHHGDVVRQVLQLHQQGKVQAGRPTTNTDNLHDNGSAFDAVLP